MTYGVRGPVHLPNTSLLLYLQSCRTQILSPSSINKAGSGQVVQVPCPNAAAVQMLLSLVW